jgi:O-antigen/teichoic acid export membrane protein
MVKSTKHSVYLIAAYGITSILNYGFSVTLSWTLPPAEFGILGVTQSLLLLTALIAGSGFSWATAYDLAAGGVTVETRLRFRTAWVVNVSLGLILGGGLWLVYVMGLLPLGREYRQILPLVSLTVVLLGARSVFNGAARGIYRFGPVAVNLVGEVAVKVGFGLVLVGAGFGVTAVVAAFAIGAAVSIVHSWWIIRPLNLWRGPGWFDLRVIGVTVPLFASFLGTALMMNLDLLGLRLLSSSGNGDEMAGMYQAAVILARTPVYLAQALTLVLFSYAAGAKGGADRREAYAETAMRSWLRFLLPAGVVLIVAPDAALGLLFPTHYQAASMALQIAALGGLLLALFNMLSGVLQADGDRRRPALAAGIATALQIVALIWLVPGWGIDGAAISLVVAGGVGLTFLGLAYKAILAHLLDVCRGVGWRVAILRPAMPLMLLALALIVVPDTGRLGAAVKLTLAGTVYVGALIAIQRQNLRLRRPVSNVLAQFVQVVVGG